MAKTFYNCPLCKKQSAYISEYGMQDSVICKCQGLNEVGLLVRGQYIPHDIPSKNPPPQPNSYVEGRPIVQTNIFPIPVSPILPQGHGNNRTGIHGTNPSIQAGVFTVYQLDLDNEVEAAGRYFNNALSSAAGRAQYMKMGIIFYAEHATDENCSLMFYVDKATREAKNFVGMKNVAIPANDENQIKVVLRQQNLISN